MMVDHVRCEGAGLTEAFLTDSTLEWLLGVVDVSAINQPCTVHGVNE